MKKIFNFWIEESTKDELFLIAKNKGVSVSKLVNDLVIKSLEDEGFVEKKREAPKLGVNNMTPEEDSSFVKAWEERMKKKIDRPE